MPYFPIYALFDDPIESVLLEQRLSVALGARLPRIEVISEQAGGRQSHALRMQGQQDDVVVRQEQDTIVAADLWDFDSEVYDRGGPSQAMADRKRATALALLRALVAECGARLAYMSSATEKLVGDPGHHELSREMAAGLSDRALLATCLQRPCYFWLVAVPEQDVALRRHITSVRPDWTVLDDDSSHVIVLEDQDEQPIFMDLGQ
ncbi:MAG: hypothetical protein MJE77_44420 [Proteobacteria bacterium]|nr:hypothetical protein [Pseudomonadota bacterium]